MLYKKSGASGPRISLSAKASSLLRAFLRLALQKAGSSVSHRNLCDGLAKFSVEAVSMSQWQGRRRAPSFGG